MPSYDDVTAQLIAAIEAGTLPWVKPWSGGDDFPRNGATGRRYSGGNVLNLWFTQAAASYPTGEWYTFQQARKLDACVRKGEKGSTIFLWTVGERKDSETESTSASDQPAGKVRRTPFMRAFTVFNRAQIEGLAPAAVPAGRTVAEAEAQATSIAAAVGARVLIGGSRAYFSPAGDLIAVPHEAAFYSSAEYAATFLHELIHWTGHRSRLAREGCNPDLSIAPGDSTVYATEELIAEIGAAFLCAQLGISGRLQHPEYLAHWLAVLKETPRVLWSAAAKAGDAADYLLLRAGLIAEEDARPGARLAPDAEPAADVAAA